MQKCLQTAVVWLHSLIFDIRHLEATLQRQAVVWLHSLIFDILSPKREQGLKAVVWLHSLIFDIKARPVMLSVGLWFDYILWSLTSCLYCGAPNIGCGLITFFDLWHRQGQRQRQGQAVVWLHSLIFDIYSSAMAQPFGAVVWLHSLIFDIIES